MISLAAALLLAAPLGAQAEDADGLSALEAAEQGTVVDADRESLEAYAEQSIAMITGMDDAQIREILKPSTILSTTSRETVASVQSWSDLKDTLGAFVEAKEHEITVTDDAITIVSSCAFENAEGVVTTTLDRRETPFTATMTFSEGGDESLGTVMAEAAMNTVMGLGIVFLTLLFLSVLISQFRHISKLENAFAKKKDAANTAPAAPAVAAAPAPAAEEELADDGELVAVIAAAVAAYEGTSADGFVVRSIRRSAGKRWQRA